MNKKMDSCDCLFFVVKYLMLQKNYEMEIYEY